MIWYCPSVIAGSGGAAGEGIQYDKSLATLAPRQIHIVLKATYAVDSVGDGGETFGMHSRKVIVWGEPEFARILDSRS